MVCTNDRGYSSVNYLDDSTEGGILGIAAFPAHDYFPYLNWKLGSFWNPAVGVMHPGANDTDDLDRDGLPTAVEYAFGRLPKTSDRNFIPLTVGTSGTASALEFRRNALRRDITYEVQHASALTGDWTPIIRSQNGEPAVSLDPGRWTVLETADGADQRVQVEELLPGALHGFFRMRIIP